MVIIDCSPSHFFQKMDQFLNTKHRFYLGAFQIETCYDGVGYKIAEVVVHHSTQHLYQRLLGNQLLLHFLQLRHQFFALTQGQFPYLLVLSAATFKQFVQCCLEDRNAQLFRGCGFLVIHYCCKIIALYDIPGQLGRLGAIQTQRLVSKQLYQSGTLVLLLGKQLLYSYKSAQLDVCVDGEQTKLYLFELDWPMFFHYLMVSTHLCFFLKLLPLLVLKHSNIFFLPAQFFPEFLNNPLPPLILHPQLILLPILITLQGLNQHLLFLQFIILDQQHIFFILESFDLLLAFRYLFSQSLNLHVLFPLLLHLELVHLGKQQIFVLVVQLLYLSVFVYQSQLQLLGLFALVYNLTFLDTLS